MTIGEFDAALEEIGKAQSLDSESTAILADKGLILYYAGRQEQAVRLLTQLEDDQPAFVSPHNYFATIWRADGNDTAYLREMKLTASARHDAQSAALADAAAKGLVLAGHSGMLRAMLAAQRGLYLSGKESAYGLAETYAALDDERDAMIYVAISVSRHETDAIALRVDPPFSALRNDSRFVALMSKAGLVTLSSARARWIRASHS